MPDVEKYHSKGDYEYLQREDGARIWNYPNNNRKWTFTDRYDHKKNQ